MGQGNESRRGRCQFAVFFFGFLVIGILSRPGVIAEQEVEQDDDVIDDTSTETRSREIALNKLEFLTQTEEGREALKAEFHSIPVGPRKPWTVASLPENIDKNRYDDLLAYDETRVVLDPLPDDPFSDYINANYIDGYNKEKEYVATQGPLPHTINDFWRMIWQLNARKIVMLANVMEHGKIKVEKYWPETNNSYGDIIVRKVNENTLGKHTIRAFSVKKVGEPSIRIVKQFHYTGWPDMGVPADRLSVVSLVQQARKYRPFDTAPLVVHCSAGVGRTGTVILMDSMMEKAKAESKVDFPKRLDHMRDQRVDVVEKEAQYIFAHEALYDALLGSGSTYLQDIENQYNEIANSNVDSNNNGLLQDVIISEADTRSFFGNK